MHGETSSPATTYSPGWRKPAWWPAVSRWQALAALISSVTVLPLLVIALSFADVNADIWAHLSEFVLPRLLANTALLLLGVGVGVLLLGVPLGWLVAVHEFPGRRVFNWALMLPLAMPAYVMAFTQIGLLDFSGVLQSWLREVWGSSAWFPPIRSRGGVVLVMSLALYPYVYLLARDAFASQGRRALEAAQSLGLSPWQGFWRVALPMARPWLIGGVSLALMEALADFGTVSIFSFDAFTTAIYKAWFAMFSLSSASQLSSLLVLLVFALIWLEQRLRGGRAYHAGRLAQPQPRLPLHGWPAALACGFASLVLLLAFVLPLGQLLVWVARVWEADLDARYIDFVWHSLALAIMAAGLVTLCALALSYAQRRDPSPTARLWVRLATLGYAVPGTVLAVGLFIPVAALDNLLIAWLGAALPEGTTAIFKGTLAVMLLAYLARFAAVGFSSVDAAMQRITRSQEETARSLGVAGFALLRRVHVPMLRGGLLTAVLMVCVDVMKEMPITLMTRPFGWDTLAVRIFEMTSEGEWERAALPAVALVLVGLLPVLLLARASSHTGARR